MYFWDDQDDEAPGLSPGSEVYVSDLKQCWIEGTIVSVQKHEYTIKLVSGEERTCKHCHVLLRAPATQLDSNSLTDLSPVNQATVLACLQHRYINRLYYTGAGSTVIAVNPFCTVPDLYSTETALRYNAHHKESEPHIYQVGAEAYKRLVREIGQVNQSIIVSGESGAGKTVSAKHLVRYMALVSNPAITSGPGRVSIVGSSIERRIIDSNPILEAFGNAITKRNDNSSRFGKYIQLQFSRTGSIQGGIIQTYLLEKTRVVHQANGECNFHIFYQLLQGLHSKKVDLSSNLQDVILKTEFKIVPVSKRMEENRDIQLTLDAMAEIGLESHEQQAVIQLICAIMFLGNTDFKAVDDDISRLSEDEDDKVLEDTYTPMEVTSEAMTTVATILGVEASQLERAFLYRSIVSGGRNKTRHSVFIKPVPQHEAYGRRDCLATVLYQRLFEWLVDFINKQIKADEFDHTIGLLDIYGFEDFSQNSLEQLCINYANEKLQQHYVKHFLKDLQREYEEERISWNFRTYTDNQPCLELLDGQPSVFGVINEDVLLNRKSNSQTLCERILELANQNNKYLSQPRKFLSDPGFKVHHYAGQVTYRGEGLTDKNRDNVPHELVEILQSSTNSFVSGLFQDFKAEDSYGRKCKTVLGKFKSSLDHLMLLLNKSDVHYIRCIKPNITGEAGVFDKQYVMSQLVANGIIETVEISRQGYQGRICYSQFLQRYSLIIRNTPTPPQSDEESKENENLYDPLDILLKKHLELADPPQRTPTPRKRLRRRAGLSSMDHTRRCCAAVMSILFPKDRDLTKQFGKTKLFLHQRQIEALEARRLEILSLKAGFIQRAWRHYRRKVERQRQTCAAIVIQKTWSRYCETKKKIQAIIVIQKLVRTMLARKNFHTKVEEGKKNKERSWKPIIDRKRRSPRIRRESSHRSRRHKLRKTSSSGSITEYESAADGSSFQTDTSQDLSSDATASSGSFWSAEANLSASSPRSPLSARSPRSHVSACSSRSHLSSSSLISVHSAGSLSSERSNDETLPKLAEPAKNKPFLMSKSATNWKEDSSMSIFCSLTSCKALPTVAGVRRGPFLPLSRNLMEAESPPVKKMRTNSGCVTTLEDLNLGDGILTRRRLPKMPIRFHTRHTALKHAHVVPRQELVCGLQDCLPDSQSDPLTHHTNQSGDTLD